MYLTACTSIRLFKFFIAWSGFIIQFCPLHPFPWWCAWGTMFAGVLFQICMHSLAVYLFQQEDYFYYTVKCSQLCFLIYHTTRCSYWIPSFHRKEPSVVMASAILVDPSCWNFSHIQSCRNASNVKICTTSYLYPAMLSIYIELLNTFQTVLTFANTIFMFTRNSNI